ncbi:hypothetical protein BU26DRAFT_514637 [Trematosphaeria pertusa]|uniref:Uncharacterized protein n=1 Tax=Trematosphaeria pertusa TaxID=390896 RepID=A0A6A6IYV0_9PLEO|nr:uncharacterized protein BU26DRAFT_514637 [Trematosphaeria pertusa]KAF2254790.1 hypothetical protein BU26DRAFT_514637 [Trematosphaeria pertusa]
MNRLCTVRSLRKWKNFERSFLATTGTEFSFNNQQTGETTSEDTAEGSQDARSVNGQPEQSTPGATESSNLNEEDRSVPSDEFFESAAEGVRIDINAFTEE